MQLSTLLTDCYINILNTIYHDLLLVLVLFLFSVSSFLLFCLIYPSESSDSFHYKKKSITLMYNGQHIPSSTFCMISRHFGWRILAIMNA